MIRKIGLLIACLLAVAVPASTARAEPQPHNAVPLHIECEDGATFDILVRSDHSLSALVEGIDSIAVLKGIDWDFDGTLDVSFGARGIGSDNLVACVASEPGKSMPTFVAYVLFTPRGHG